MKDFNKIAGVYDGLKKLMFGNTLDRAAHRFLNLVKDDDHVLILGGGTGDILSHLNTSKITFLDSSSKMVEKARLKAPASSTFIIADFQDYESDLKFDWIICPFFLDVFSEGKLPGVIKKLQDLLEKNGSIIVTDFQSVSIFQSALLFFMYLFFNLTTQIDHFRIQPIHFNLLKAGFEEREALFFMQSFIFSRIYTFKGNPQ